MVNFYMEKIQESIQNTFKDILSGNVSPRSIQTKLKENISNLTELDLEPTTEHDYYVQTLSNGTVLEIRDHHLNNGKLIIIDIKTGRSKNVLKIDNGKISRPYVLNNNMYIIRDNAIIKLN